MVVKISNSYYHVSSAVRDGVKPPLKVYHIGSGFSTVSKRRGEQKNSLAACHIATRG